MTRSGASRRLPMSYLAASYLEHLPSILGLCVTGVVLTLKDGLWPGAWGWLLLGPLILARVLSPAYVRQTFRYSYTPFGLTARTGLLQQRSRTIEWQAVQTLDKKDPWSYRLFGICRVEALQGGSENTRIILPGVPVATYAQIVEYTSDRTDGAKAAPLEISRSSIEPTDAGRPVGARSVYRSNQRDLAIAGLIYGQFAVLGGGLAFGAYDLLQYSGLDTTVLHVLTGSPCLFGLLALLIILTFGLLLTMIKFHQFEVQSAKDGSIYIRYGLFNRHERKVHATSVVGYVFQRNLVELLSGRVRLSLLTTDSAGQLGANLVLPSLPIKVVQDISVKSFGGPTQADLLCKPALRSIARSAAHILLPLFTVMIAVWAMVINFSPAGWILALTGMLIYLGLYWLGWILSTRLSVSPDPVMAIRSTRHMSERYWAVDASVVHLVATFHIKERPMLTKVHFYSGLPRSLWSIGFASSDVLMLQNTLTRLAPEIVSHRTRRDLPRDD